MKHDSGNHATLASIVGSLEADIIFGRLRPHQELVEDTLMARFDAKRHVVRSAIQALVDRHIVIKPRARSARVKDFTPREVDELYAMRALLQREAVNLMPFPVDGAALQALRALHEEYAEAALGGADPLQIHQLNDRFHQQLFALCGNETLCKAISFYTEATNPIRSYGITDKAWLTQAIGEHAAMLDAMETQNRATLADLVVQHMQPTRLRWESLHGAA
ncbi:GntR family transcriptional regulator [Paracandidimonas soli]|uniref:GntR family transcriptional regulator n=1 Tax=Paracandidimonas soli TaxID=1917182 RepID=A0A4R3VC94_9BURK|nr:GntR family transcriptional regulator [Paracandidimonas soli]TCV02937.1 GntR family transcriptional regulator [Paracandidimonas soli]